jgi:dTDP-glucose pyrophosphorylase
LEITTNIVFPNSLKNYAMIEVVEDLNCFLVKKEFTIKECMSKIESNKKGIVIVIDNDNKLLGTLSDGDIRRAILGGVSTERSIDNYFNIRPLSLSVDYSVRNAEELFQKMNLSVIPILDNNGCVKKILKRSNGTQDYSQIDNYVVLMVGGLGSRLAPLTDETPKPLLKVGDKPILETIFVRLKLFGFRNVILCTGYRHDDIEDFCGDGSRFGLNIKYFKEEKRLGTIGAIKKVESFLKESFIVMNGDLLTLLNYRHILNYHKENQSHLTIGSTAHQMKVPYGVLEMDGIYIREVKEKPIFSFRVSGGIYVLDPSLIDYIPMDEYFDITDLMGEAIKNNNILSAFPIEEYWMDIGQHQDYCKANLDYNNLFNI